MSVGRPLHRQSEPPSEMLGQALLQRLQKCLLWSVLEIRTGIFGCLDLYHSPASSTIAPGELSQSSRHTRISAQLGGSRGMSNFWNCVALRKIDLAHMGAYS